jgi:hypothetical protein
MGRETIKFVNIDLCSQCEMTVSQDLFEITASSNVGPWIPITPGSEQIQDLSEAWHEEDDY